MMQLSSKTVIHSLLFLLLFTTFTVSAQPETRPGMTPGSRPIAAKTDRAQLLAAVEKGEVRVIVGLHRGAAPASLFSEFKLKGVSPKNIRQFDHIPYMSMTVDAKGLEVLTRSGLVSSIQHDSINFLHLTMSTTQIGAAGAEGAWEMGYDGTGQTVAVLDTGIDRTHPFIEGKVKSEACYSSSGVIYDPYIGGITIASACPNGVEASTDTGSAMPCLGFGCEHGTHVAGIVAGANAGMNGVAKGADLIAVQVFTLITTNSVCAGAGYETPCAVAFDSDIIEGLSRVYALRGQYNIAAVNISIGGGAYENEASCDADNSATKAMTDLLRSANIAVIASSGNDGYVDAVSAPGCISGVVSVGAVTDSDQVAYFSNAAYFLDLLAPGATIYSSVPGGFDYMSGTSMASPHVAGAWAVLKQKSPGANVDRIETALKKTGMSVADYGGVFPRIRVNEGIRFLTKPGKPSLVTPLQEEILHQPPLLFTWTETEDTEAYKLTVKNEKGEKVFGQTLPIYSCVDQTCSYLMDTPLPKNGRYTWSIKAINIYNQNKSEKRTIVADYPGAPTLTTPPNGTVLVNQADWETLQWSSVEGADYYNIIVKDVEIGEKVLKVENWSRNNCFDGKCIYMIAEYQRTVLSDGHNYKWFVQAGSAYGKSRSQKWTFKARF
jgi:subtilisin family serine protease